MYVMEALNPASKVAVRSFKKTHIYIIMYAFHGDIVLLHFRLQ